MRERGLITSAEAQTVNDEIKILGEENVNAEGRFDLNYLRDVKKKWDNRNRSEILATFYGGSNGSKFMRDDFQVYRLTDMFRFEENMTYIVFALLGGSILFVFGGGFISCVWNEGFAFAISQKPLVIPTLFFTSMMVNVFATFIGKQKLTQMKASNLMGEWIAKVESCGAKYLKSEDTLNKIRELARNRFEVLQASHLERQILEEVERERVIRRQGIAKPDAQYLIRIQTFGDAGGAGNSATRFNEQSRLYQYLIEERDLLPGEREPLADLALRIQQSSLIDTDKKSLADAVIFELKKYPGDVHKALLHADLRVTTELMALDKGPIVTENMSCSTLMHYSERLKSLGR